MDSYLHGLIPRYMKSYLHGLIPRYMDSYQHGVVLLVSIASLSDPKKVFFASKTSVLF